MARSTRQPPTKDPTYDPKRVDDRPVFWAYSIADRITWPITLFFLVFLGGISLVWLKYGETRAIALLAFLQDNVIQALVGILAVATVAVLRKVPQLGRFEKRQAATQQEVEQARAVSEQVLQAVKSAPPAAPRESDPTTGEIAVLVNKISTDMGTINERLRRVEEGANAAAEASLGARDTVVGYGGVLREFATAVSAVTGQTPAQRPPEPAPEPEWPGSRYGRPEARTEPEEYREDWSRRDGSHRAETTRQAAIQGADEQEDWQEPADDGDGLDTGYRTGFREQMAAAEARERAAREVAKQSPARTPRFPVNRPTVVPAWEPRPSVDPAEEQARQQRARRWTNPEEGPQ